MFASLVHVIESVARRTPGAAALSWHRAVWTYEGLSRAIDCVAGALLGQALPSDSRVALLIRNSPQYAAAYYGAMAAGQTAVPLNVQERANVLKRQIEHSGAKLLLADPAHPEFAVLVASLADANVTVLTVNMSDGADACNVFCASLPPGAGAAARAELSPDQLACILYTSGTTGRPKGVMLSHGNLLANARTIAAYLDIRPDDKVLCPLPFHFSYGASVLNSNLSAGAQVLLEDNSAFPQVLARRMQDEGVTAFPGVPATFALLLGRCKLRDFDLSRLRYLTQAGGSMPRAQIELLRATVPHAKVFIMYGQTEATARLTYLAPELLEKKLGSVGLPLSGVEIEIRDADGGCVPVGEIGEICARGPNVMLGYWQDAELTAQTLRGGWLHTGDLAHSDAEGYLYIDGRVADMIKVGAFRVSPQEVEEVLAALPSVEEVAVTAIPDEMLGQAIKAVIVLRPQMQLDAMAVKAHCRQHLATYKIPKLVEFAAVLPRTSSGKVQRYKLA